MLCAIQQITTNVPKNKVYSRPSLYILQQVAYLQTHKPRTLSLYFLFPAFLYCCLQIVENPKKDKKRKEKINSSIRSLAAAVLEGWLDFKG